PGQVADALATHADVPRALSRQALADARRRPNQAVPVATVPDADYLAVKDAIYPVPGLSFEAGTGREYNGPASGQLLLGSVRPGTPPRPKERGAPPPTGGE